MVTSKKTWMGYVLFILLKVSKKIDQSILRTEAKKHVCAELFIWEILTGFLACTLALESHAKLN